jgi:hypothetical protein
MSAAALFPAVSALVKSLMVRSLLQLCKMIARHVCVITSGKPPQNHTDSFHACC